MLKKILNLEGAQQLTNNEQKSISGGKLPAYCSGDETCWSYSGCHEGMIARCIQGYCMLDVC